MKLSTIVKVFVILLLCSCNRTNGDTTSTKVETGQRCFGEGANGVSESDSKTEASLERKNIVVSNHDNICLRSNPNESSKLEGINNPHFNDGDILECTGEVGEYYEVYYDGCKYYFPKKYAKYADQSNAQTENLKTSLSVKEFLDAAKKVADWYYANNTPYQADGVWYKDPKCPYSGNKKCKRDCSGYLSIVLQYCGVFAPDEAYNSISFKSDNNSCAKSLKKGGFQPIFGEFPQEDFNKFAPGDILAVNRGDQHHVTIYAGNGRFYDYGGKAPGHKQPISGVVADKEMNPHTYTVIWRLKK